MLIPNEIYELLIVIVYFEYLFLKKICQPNFSFQVIISMTERVMLKNKQLSSFWILISYLPFM